MTCNQSNTMMLNFQGGQYLRTYENVFLVIVVMIITILFCFLKLFIGGMFSWQQSHKDWNRNMSRSSILFACIFYFQNIYIIALYLLKLFIILTFSFSSKSLYNLYWS